VTPPGWTVLQLVLLAGLFLVGPVVVLTREPRAQTVALTFYGLVFGLVFFAFQAPDVALAQLVVGAVVLPILVLLTLARMRRGGRPSPSRPERRS
jgi:energy-converting hydrogenase B subunit D